MKGAYSQGHSNKSSSIGIIFLYNFIVFGMTLIRNFNLIFYYSLMIQLI